MLSCSKTRGVLSLAAVGVCLFMTRSVEAAEPAEQAPPPSEEVDPSFRIDLGMGLSGVMNGAAGAVGTLGAFSTMAPFAQTSFEGHLAGPVWLVVRARGGYSRSTMGPAEAEVWNAGLVTGPRFEFPVVPRVDVGGHVLVEGSYAHASSDDDANDAWANSEQLSIGGIAGTSVHFRVTPLFGVRLAIDLLRAGYAWRGADDSSAAYAQLTADPSIAMTFTF